MTISAPILDFALSSIVRFAVSIICGGLYTGCSNDVHIQESIVCKEVKLKYFYPLIKVCYDSLSPRPVETISMQSIGCAYTTMPWAWTVQYSDSVLSMKAFDSEAFHCFGRNLNPYGYEHIDEAISVLFSEVHLPQNKLDTNDSFANYIILDWEKADSIIAQQIETRYMKRISPLISARLISSRFDEPDCSCTFLTWFANKGLICFTLKWNAGVLQDIQYKHVGFLGNERML